MLCKDETMLVFVGFFFIRQPCRREAALLKYTNTCVDQINVIYHILKFAKLVMTMVQVTLVRGGS